jgi:hypothetical protein
MNGIGKERLIRRGETMRVSQTIDGNTLIAWGFRPGRWFKDALETAHIMRAGGADDDAMRCRPCSRSRH